MIMFSNWARHVDEMPRRRLSESHTRLITSGLSHTLIASFVKDGYDIQVVPASIGMHLGFWFFLCVQVED